MVIRSETVIKEVYLMPSGYHHLGYDERSLIAVLESMGLSLRQIAKRLGRSASTISRES